MHHVRFTPKADIAERWEHVRCVPIADTLQGHCPFLLLGDCQFVVSGSPLP